MTALRHLAAAEAAVAPPPLPIPLRIDTCESRDYRRGLSIQPHGWLVAFDPATLRIVQASANAAAAIGDRRGSLIGEALGDCLAPASLAQIVMLTARNGANAAARNFLTVQGAGTPALCGAGFLYPSDALYCLELDWTTAEPSQPPGAALPFLTMIERINGAELPSSALADVVCDVIRGATGFDRIYFCRFDGQGHGQVLAERATGRLPSLLDHRFPATDIPWAVRSLYEINPFRHAADVDAPPVPIAGGGAPLDMALSACRAIAPTHLHYLRNMGVRASVSFSVVTGGRLEALFGGHHAEARVLPMRCLVECQHVVDLYKTRYGLLKLREETALIAARRHALQGLCQAYRQAGRDLVAFVAANHAPLCALMDADDVLCRFEGQIHGGRALGEAAAGRVIDLLAQHAAAAAGAGAEAEAEAEAEAKAGAKAGAGAGAGRDIVAVDCLAGLDPDLAAIAPSAAGALAAPLDLAAGHILVWLRRETIVLERWSGDPHQFSTGDGGAVGPRASFAAYQRLMKGTCRPWSGVTADLARQLRHAFNEVLAAHYESAMRAAAEQANASKSAFIANISHELRSPMHAIIGLSDILARDEDATPAAKRQHYATTIRDCGNRLLRLIEDLLDLSRLGSGRMPFHFTAADIAGTIEAAIGETASLAARNQIGIVYERPDTRSICLHDIARMQQVVINLLANAIKFSPSGATVTITHTAPGADPSGADVLLEVADAGTGIPHDEIEAIFETFVQSSRTKTGAGGSGLGLSISRAIVEAHQGRIWAANNRDGGASLFVSLPCRPVARTGAPP